MIEQAGQMHDTFDCDTGTGRLVGLSRWESEQAFRDALALIGSLSHERRDEWSERPDDVLTLTPM